jgi:hypothetical protein
MCRGDRSATLPKRNGFRRLTHSTLDISLSSSHQTTSEASDADRAAREERRQSDDRRDKPTGFIDSLSGKARRRHGRRQGESENSYVDVYHRRDVLLILAIFIFNVFDAVFTLAWLQRGGTEANPAMDYLIRVGDSAFLLQKCFVVGIWLLILIVHKNFRVARLGLWMLLALYGLIFLYHAHLNLNGVSPITGLQ